MSTDKNGHKMFHYITDDLFFCDSCSIRIPNGKLILSCEKCDYDLCENCFPKTFNKNENELILLNTFSQNIYRKGKFSFSKENNELTKLEKNFREGLELINELKSKKKFDFFPNQNISGSSLQVICEKCGFGIKGAQGCCSYPYY